MFHIIINPASSSGQGTHSWSEIEPYFRRSRRPYRTYFPSEGKSVGQIVRRVTRDASAKKEPCSLIILGGDGTINEAVNAIYDFSNVRFGFIPTGSANDLARDMGLTGDVSAVIARILENRIRRTCDVGEVVFHNRTQDDGHSTRRRLFNISCGIGYDAAICREADHSKLKPVLNALHLGEMIYFAEAIGQLLKSPMVPCKIVTDSGLTIQKRRMFFTVIMNRRFEGGGFPFCPHADAGDGLLDLCMVADVKSRMEFFRLVPEILQGTHGREDCFVLHLAGSFDIRTGIPLWVHTDGEVHCKSSHITVTLAKKKLRMLV